VAKEIDAIGEVQILRKIDKAYDAIEAAAIIRDIPNCKKMPGNPPNAYRIRVGDYRVGTYLLTDGSAEIARIRHRRDIYKVFP